MSGRLRSVVPDQFVRGYSKYTTEQAAIQLQAISNMTMSPVPIMRARNGTSGAAAGLVLWLHFRSSQNAPEAR